MGEKHELVWALAITSALLAALPGRAPLFLVIDGCGDEKQHLGCSAPALLDPLRSSCPG